MNQLSKNKKNHAILAVKAATKNKDSFRAIVDVNVNIDDECQWNYQQINTAIYYDVKYKQFTVEIYWEEDKQSEEYKDRDLFGIYNTNFNEMEFRDDNLYITDGNKCIILMF